MVVGAPYTLELEREAQLLSTYLIKSLPMPAHTALYISAISTDNVSSDDVKLLGYVHKHPWSLAFIDAALPFYRPHSELRRRIYLMLAILEASPNYSQDFLPQKRSPAYIVIIGLTGVSAVYKALCGLVLVRVVL